MTQHIYYTIIIHQRFCMVKYAIVPACEILTFPGTFDDPGEASQEFKKAVDGKLECLSEKAFERKVSDLHTRYKQDLAKLADWSTGKAIRI